MASNQNKANVIAFYETMFNECRSAEAILRYDGADYIQHNPHVATGKQGFIDYSENPNDGLTERPLSTHFGRRR